MAATTTRTRHLNGYAGTALPKDGCFTEGWRQLAKGRTPFDVGLPGRLAGDAFQQSKNDSRVRSAWQAWSTCLATAGYSYSSPSQPGERFVGAASATPEEIATAVADVRCRQETNLVGIWMAVETAYQRRLMAEHEGELQERQRRLDEDLAEARRVVAQGA